MKSSRRPAHDRQNRGRAQEPDQASLDHVIELLGEVSRRTATCQRFCSGRAECCRFHLTGEIPHVTLPEAWLVWKAWKATGRTSVAKTAGECPFLDEQGRCRIYEKRPVACRTHFCVEAGGVVPRKLISDILDELKDMDTKWGGNGAERLPDIVRRLSKR
jgi:hypothetical protein